MGDFAVIAYTQVLECALPVAVVFAIGDLLATTFMRVAFGGKLWFGR